MFFGTTPAIISQFLYNEIKQHNPKRVIVPFAGNFVIEQIAGLVSKDIKVLSTDISIYSRAIGYGLGNVESEIEIKEEMLNTFEILRNKKTPLEKAACVIFLTEAAKNYKKKEKIRYYEMLHKDALANQQMYYEKIYAKLTKFKEGLPKDFKFYGTDACELMDNDLQENDLIFYDPPVLLGDYEKMFTPLEEQLIYKEPSYTEMNAEVKDKQLKDLSKKHIVYYRRNDVGNTPEGYTEVLRYRYKNRGYYTVYTNKPDKTFVGTFKPLKEEIKNYPIINKNDEITRKSKIEIMPVSGKIANHYRLMWVKKAEMTDSGYSYLILCDKKIIGLATLESGVKFSSDYIPIFSDPAAPTSKYKRLSRLILWIICTKEFLNKFNDVTMWEHLGFTTRVFTNAPVSMKYRGKFELAKREEDKGGDFKYKLIYQNTKKLCATTKQALGEWIDKYSKDIYDERD
tara:strand:+ start:6439 stop:7806 length:1368 start_codon:yes stop_codon:yes gene_type:complete